MKKTICLVLALLALFSFVSCDNEVAEAETPLAWEYLSGLPEGFPKLCDGITAEDESFDANKSSITLYWNVLEENSYNVYLTKIQSWAGTDFGEAKKGTKTLTFKKGGDEITVAATYDGDANGKSNGDGSYDYQAMIVITSKVIKAEKYTPVKWEYLFLLPEGFPKLCDCITTTDEIYGEEATALAMYWNILDKASFDSYVKKIEDTAGASFGEAAADGTRVIKFTLKGKEITVKAAYNESATGIYLEGNNYDCQARIEVSVPKA